jgi:hypothetical protein
MKMAIHIEGGKATALNRQALVALAKALERAVELGREAAAVAIAERIGQIAGVSGTTITNCNFQSGKAS